VRPQSLAPFRLLPKVFYIGGIQPEPRQLGFDGRRIRLYGYLPGPWLQWDGVRICVQRARPSTGGAQG